MFYAYSTYICSYVSFETNIRISNFIFEYPNIRIFSEYSNIRLSPSIVASLPWGDAIILLQQIAKLTMQLLL